MEVGSRHRPQHTWPKLLAYITYRVGFAVCVSAPAHVCGEQKTTSNVRVARAHFSSEGVFLQLCWSSLSNEQNGEAAGWLARSICFFSAGMTHYKPRCHHAFLYGLSISLAHSLLKEHLLATILCLSEILD